MPPYLGNKEGCILIICCGKASTNASGIFNVASRDVISKLEFCKKIFKKLKIRPDFSLKSVKTLDVKRANNNGLDISKVENFLSMKMPNTTNTAECIVNDYMKIKK